MPDEVVRGRSLAEIREEWSNKLGVSPEQVMLEVLEKPGVFSRQWKVRVSWPSAEENEATGNSIDAGSDVAEAAVGNTFEDEAPEGEQGDLQSVGILLQEGHYVITSPPGLHKVIPFPQGGSLVFNGKEQEVSFAVAPGDVFEYYPADEPGERTWRLDIRHQGLSVVAKVKKREPGRFVLSVTLKVGEMLDFQEALHWEKTAPRGEYWDQDHLQRDFAEAKVIHGLRAEAWDEILGAKDGEEVIVAQATLPTAGVSARLEEFIGVEAIAQEEKGRVDFFASKIQLVQEGDLLARKTPGSPGVPGIDVLGRSIPVQQVKDFQFRLKKNVHLSADGLEVLASCPGRPVRFETYTYGVDNIYVLNQDADLATGSIEFSGDVLINGNVQDGLRVIAGGKVEIRGGASHAEIRGEKGVVIFRPVQGGKIVVGEKHVVRAGLLSHLKELREELNSCLRQTAELASSPNATHLKPGQCLKVIIERNFFELPKKAAELEKFVLSHKDELITQDLIVSVRTAKRFLGGLGPLELQSVPLLLRVEQALKQLVENIAIEVPENLRCEVDYIQGTAVECGGDFVCSKGAYNALVRVDGNVEIQGVCRGGKISAGGNVKVRELGGSEVSSTFVQITGTKRLEVDYCHPNVVIAVNKEILRVEEAYKSLVVYRERGKVQMEKIRVNPL